MDESLNKRFDFLSNYKREGKKITIGFTGVADYRSFIDKKIIEGVAQAAQDYELNFINMSYSVKHSIYEELNFIPVYLKNFQFLKAPLIDGAITWASTLCQFIPTENVIKTFSSLHPLPMVDIGYLDIPKVPSIRIDNSQSLHLIMEHLVNHHKYKNFIFIGTEGSQPNQRRLQAFQNELKYFDLPTLPNSIYMAKSQKSNHIGEVLKELQSNYKLIQKREIDAIITPSDIIAAEIIRQLHQKGISVPSDVAITGYNNWFDGLTSETPVTTIDLEYFKRGYLAVEMLIDKLANPKEILQNRLLPTSLIIRESCGCLEESIYKSFYIQKENINENYQKYTNIHQYLENAIKKSIPEIPKHSAKSLIKSFFIDIYSENNQGSMLNWFQQIIRHSKKNNNFNTNFLQNGVSNLREILIPIVINNHSQMIKLENIFHQMRILISINQNYQLITAKENPYLTNNLSQLALSFNDPKTKEELNDFLDNLFSLFDIKKAIIALSQNKSYSLPPCEISIIYPHDKELLEKIPYKISDPEFFPKEFFPSEEPFQLILEILNYDDFYFGYTFLELNKKTILNYNILRMLLCRALFNFYKTRTKTKEYNFIENLENNTNQLKKPQRITTKTLTDYFESHLSEMTDINKMAESLHVSRSYIIKKTKKLTNLTIQELNEKIKIQHGIELIERGDISFADIAKELGFKNQNYFSTVFKKVTGLTPNQWKKKNS